MERPARFAILGPLDVRDGMGRSVGVGRRRVRLLLGALLLHAGTPIPVERLLSWLWDDDLPASARANLHTHVSDLRRVLEGAGLGRRLRSRAGAYVFEVDAGEVDASWFCDLVTAARDDVENAPDSAVASLTRALNLWRSDRVLDGLDLPEPLVAEAVRLQELHATAREDLIDARLAVGEHREVLPELYAAIAADPMRERHRAQLMLALHRSGRRADALEAYRRAREHGVAELGIDPSASLRELHRRILNDDPDLAPPPRMDTRGRSRPPGPPTEVSGPASEPAGSRGVGEQGPVHRAAGAPAVAGGVAPPSLAGSESPDHAYAELDGQARRLYRLLAVHPGSDLDVAAAAALGGLPEVDASRLVGDLAAAGLVRESQPGRYGFSEPARRHAIGCADREESEDQRVDAFARLCAFYVRWAKVAAAVSYPHETRVDVARVDTADPVADVAGGPPDVTGDVNLGERGWTGWLDLELENLLAVADAAAARSPACTVALSQALHAHLRLRAHYGRAITLHRRAADAAYRMGDLRRCGRAYVPMGRIHYLEADYEQADTCFSRALELARQAGDDGDVLDALCGLARVDYLVGRYDLAGDRYQEALDLAEMVDDPRSQMVARAGLGNLTRTRGDLLVAQSHYRRAYETAERIGYTIGRLHALNGLGRVDLGLGRLTRAEERFEHLRSASVELGYRLTELHALCNLGRVERARHHWPAAVTRLDQALRLADAIGDRNYRFESLLELGHTHRESGGPHDATIHYTRALQAAEELAQPTDIARALDGLARAALDSHDPLTADRHRQRARQILDDLGLTTVEEIRIDALRPQS